MQHYLYLTLDLVMVTLLLIIGKGARINFYNKRKGLLSGIAVMMLLFIPLDIFFCQQAYWGFEKNFTIRYEILGLPIEELLFVAILPYSFMYVYEFVLHRSKKNHLRKPASILSLAVGGVLLALGVMNFEKAYTALAFLLCSSVLIYHGLKKTAWIGRFLMSYLLTLFPFFFVESLRSGSLIPMPIVWYNNAENMAVRIGTVPVENFVYLLLMLLIVTQFYERALRQAHERT